MRIRTDDIPTTRRGTDNQKWLALVGSLAAGEAELTRAVEGSVVSTTCAAIGRIRKAGLTDARTRQRRRDDGLFDLYVFRPNANGN